MHENFILPLPLQLHKHGQITLLLGSVLLMIITIFGLKLLKVNNG